jgi:hypothetical protein
MMQATHAITLVSLHLTNSWVDAHFDNLEANSAYNNILNVDNLPCEIWKMIEYLPKIKMNVSWQILPYQFIIG